MLKQWPTTSRLTVWTGDDHDGEDVMIDDCPFQPQLDAYHDGELASDARLRVERHLATCPACATDLADLRELSTGITTAADRPAPITSAESHRLHDAVDHAEDDAPYSLPFLRTAGLLTALAASVLIVCGVWLLDTVGHVTTNPGGVVAGSTPVVRIGADWEYLAMTGHADPSPDLYDNSQMSNSPLSPRYAATVQWMLSGLTPVDQKQWVKPGSY